MPSMWAKASQGSRSKDMPVNFTSLGVGAHSASLRRRVSRDVFTVARGQNFVAGKATAGMEPILNKTSMIMDHPDNNNFTIRLNKEPINKTKAILTSQNTEQVSLSLTEIIFDKTNWNIEQTIQVIPANDNEINTSINVSILHGATVSINITDELRDLELSTTEFNLVQGASATFTLSLTQPPRAGISFEITSSDSTRISTTPQITHFAAGATTDNTITLITVDDLIADGPFTGTLTIEPVLGGSEEYISLSEKSITVNTTNPNVAGFTIVSPSSPTTVAEGATQTIQIKLDSQPTSSVEIVPSTTNKFTFSPTTLTFEPNNDNNKIWSNPQDISATAVRDYQVIGDRPVDISFASTTTTDDKYLFSSTDLSGTISLIHGDTDVATITSTLVDQPIEEGETITFDVSLSSYPTSDVSLVITTGTEGLTVDPSHVYMEWDDTNKMVTSQTITMTAEIGYTLPSAYDVSINTLTTALEYIDVSLVRQITYANTIDPAITTTLTNQTITEGNTVNFDVSLTLLPASDVSLVITTGSDGLEVDPSNIFVGDENGIITVTDISLTALVGEFSDGIYDISINTVTSDGNYTDISLVRQITYQG